MRVMRLIITNFFIFLFFFGLHAQQFKQFSEDSDKFLNELNSLFSKIRIKKNRVKCEDMMEKYTEYWNIGIFTKEIKKNMQDICNLMLKRRMKAYPHFYQYISCMNGLMDYDHSIKSYLAWYKSIDALVKDKRSTKPISVFLNTSHNLLYENILYKTRAAEWTSNTYEFYFVYDSVPGVVFEDLTLTCYANKDSSVIYDTKGIYFPLQSKWIGKKGKINWKRAGFGC